MSVDIPKKITDQMMCHDAFSKWLKIERIKDDVGQSIISMKVRKEMLNGFKILHGGISFALADSALAFAANSHKQQAVSIENSIHYHKTATEGDVLTATANEISKSSKLGVYEVKIVNQNNELISSFKGTVLRTNREWEVD